MAKQETSTFWSELLTAGLYKPSQGRLARQLTAAALAIMVVSGAYVLMVGPLQASTKAIQVAVPMTIVALGGWVAFRLVNYPRFAEFLISVEAEMAKVSWAPKQELVRATIVVLSTMFFLAVVLFAYDFIWQTLFRWIGVLPSGD
ncbi:MAG: preprotein translocase subunit SecE [Planctomycetes bacterium]|nr:preprotein translocase subunit SecE [Planctomycetota bacterium]